MSSRSASIQRKRGVIRLIRNGVYDETYAIFDTLLRHMQRIVYYFPDPIKPIFEIYCKYNIYCLFSNFVSYFGFTVSPTDKVKYNEMIYY